MLLDSEEPMPLLGKVIWGVIFLVPALLILPFALLELFCRILPKKRDFYAFYD